AFHVTGVQTCALPISGGKGLYAINATDPSALKSRTTGGNQVLWELKGSNASVGYIFGDVDTGPIKDGSTVKWVALVGNGVESARSEERRGGKDGRARG